MGTKEELTLLTPQSQTSALGLWENTLQHVTLTPLTHIPSAGLCAAVPSD